MKQGQGKARLTTHETRNGHRFLALPELGIGGHFGVGLEASG
jgi:hypothetical protein